VCSTHSYFTAVKNAFKIAAANNFIVMASGNEGRNAKNNLPGCVRIGNDPIKDARLLTVGAVSFDEQCAKYSNYGKRVDLLAVGSDVFVFT
jgi:subtilisin family serine protease